MYYNLSFSRLTVLEAPFLLVTYVNSLKCLYCQSSGGKNQLFIAKRNTLFIFLRIKKSICQFPEKKKEVENDKLNYKKNGKI